ncbi:RNA polymerase sigma factor [Nocardia sp. NPDC003726]
MGAVEGAAAVGRKEFEQFHDRYSARVRSLINWYLLYWGWQADRDDEVMLTTLEHEDIYNDVMVTVFEQWEKVQTRERAELVQWLDELVKAGCIQYFLRFSTYPVVSDDVLRERAATDYTPNGADAVIAKELWVQTVRALSPRQREVWSRAYKGYNNTEIANQLGMTPEAVRKQLSRSKQIVQHQAEARDNAVAEDLGFAVREQKQTRGAPRLLHGQLPHVVAMLRRTINSALKRLSNGRTSG